MAYVWKVVETLYFAEPSDAAAKAKEAPLTMLVPLYVVIGATVVFGVLPKWSTDLAQHAAEFLIAGGGS